MITFEDVEPWVLSIAEGIFESKIEHMVTSPYQEGWTVWVGAEAWHRLVVIGPGVRFKIGLQVGGHRIAETGQLSTNHILGVTVLEDEAGPERQWRLSARDGRTLRWGEWKG